MKLPLLAALLLTATFSHAEDIAPSSKASGESLSPRELARISELRQWMAEHSLRRAIALGSSGFWGGELLFLGLEQPGSETARFYLRQYSHEEKPKSARGTISRGSHVEQLFRDSVYRLGESIKGIPKDDTRSIVEDADSYLFVQIEDGHPPKTISRRGEDTPYFEPAFRRQTDAFWQVIKTINETKKKRSR